MKRINELTQLTTLRSADEVVVRDSVTGETSRTTLGTLFAVFGGVVESDYQLLWGVLPNVPVEGSRLTFSRQFDNSDYVIQTFAQDTDGDVIVVTQGTVADGTKAATFIDLFPAVAAPAIGWIAIGEKLT